MLTLRVVNNAIIVKMPIFQGGFPFFNTNCVKPVGRTVNILHNMRQLGGLSTLHIF